ncbi:MAG TPA: hypothetical protein DDW19_03050 [Anaerolineaceae bacterium]|jgi:hypothetical protein|nr:hypothetical protein [Anaerolineaceae bacterium]
MKIVKASELGVYLYCQRAWSYQRQGMVSRNQAELDMGTAYHKKHGSAVMQAGVLRVLSVLMISLAAIVLVLMILQWAGG